MLDYSDGEGVWDVSSFWIMTSLWRITTPSVNLVCTRSFKSSSISSFTRGAAASPVCENSFLFGYPVEGMKHRLIVTSLIFGQTSVSLAGQDSSIRQQNERSERQAWRTNAMHIKKKKHTSIDRSRRHLFNDKLSVSLL